MPKFVNGLLIVLLVTCYLSLVTLIHAQYSDSGYSGNDGGYGDGGYSDSSYEGGYEASYEGGYQSGYVGGGSPTCTGLMGACTSSGSCCVGLVCVNDKCQATSTVEGRVFIDNPPRGTGFSTGDVPFPGRTVILNNGGNNYGGQRVTDSGGWYVFTGVPPWHNGYEALHAPPPGYTGSVPASIGGWQQNWIGELPGNGANITGQDFGVYQAIALITSYSDFCRFVSGSTFTPSVTINWTSIPEAISYDLRRDTVPSTGWVTVNTNPITTTSHTDTSTQYPLLQNTTYIYQVITNTAGGASGSPYSPQILTKNCSNPTIDLKINGNQLQARITSGSTANLTYTVNNATTCTKTTVPPTDLPSWSDSNWTGTIPINTSPFTGTPTDTSVLTNTSGALRSYGYRLTCTNQEILAYGSGNAYPFSTGLMSGLVSYWKLDEINSSDPIDDIHGTNDGVASGATATTSGCKIGNCKTYDGVDDFISVNNASSINFDNTQPFSISAWVKTTSSSSVKSIVAKQVSDSTIKGYHLYKSAGNQLCFSLVNNNSTSNLINVCGNETINNGNWRHVVVTYSGSSTAAGVSLYVDSAKQTNSILSNSLSGSTTTSQPIQLGQRWNEPSWNGSIDEVGIWNRALTGPDTVPLGSEVRQLWGYNSLATAASTVFAEVCPPNPAKIETSGGDVHSNLQIKNTAGGCN